MGKFSFEENKTNCESCTLEALRPRKKTTDFRLAVECISVVLVSSITFVQPKREESTERFGAQRERERGDGERGTFALLAQKTPMIYSALLGAVLPCSTHAF